MDTTTHPAVPEDRTAYESALSCRRLEAVVGRRVFFRSENAGLREDSAPVTIVCVGAEIWIYSLIYFANAERMCEHHLLLKATRPSFSNANQRDEDRASDLADTERERLTERYRVGVLAERCGALHEHRLVGELQLSPIGEELYADEPVLDLAIWVADTKFGPPWVILGTAASEAAFWREVEEDDDVLALITLGPKKSARQIIVDFIPEFARGD